MDLDAARQTILDDAALLPVGTRGVLLGLLDVVGSLDNDLAGLELRVKACEQMIDRLEEVINEGHGKV